MAVRKGARERKNEAHVLSIQKNAQQLFDQYGFERVTIADICEAANVSKSTFYNLYESKDDLFMLAHSKLRGQFIQAHYTYDEVRPLRELLREFYHVNFDYAISMGRAETRNLYKGYMNTGKLLPQLPQTNIYIAELYKLIERGMNEHAFRQELSLHSHYQLMTDTMLGMFIGWCTHFRDDADLDTHYRHLIDALVDGFLKEQEGNEPAGRRDGEEA